DTPGRDDPGPVALRMRASTGVVRAAIRVVRPPRCQGRSAAGLTGRIVRNISAPRRAPHFKSRRRRLEGAEGIATFPAVFRRIMMQMTQGWMRLRSVAIALGLFAWASVSAKADGILTYSTSGFISGTSGVTGTNAITYESITNASVDTTSNLPLGAFQVAKLTGDSTTTTYNNTPFSFTVLPSKYTEESLKDLTHLTVTAGLNGTLTGDSKSNVIATINPLPSDTLQLGSATSTLAGLPNQLLLVPASAGGTTTLEGAIATAGTVNPQAPVPEPSTVALFLSTVGGLALRRLVLSRR